ncbi:hypothetical protein GCK32_015891, partial [Trichostrongylus colubriformis]
KIPLHNLARAQHRRRAMEHICKPGAMRRFLCSLQHSGACPNELEQHYNPITGQPQLCDAKTKNGCPLGFECVKTYVFEHLLYEPLGPKSISSCLIQFSIRSDLLPHNCRLSGS